MITFAGGDDYVFALPCVDASKTCPVQQHELSIEEWAGGGDSSEHYGAALASASVGRVRWPSRHAS